MDDASRTPTDVTLMDARALSAAIHAREVSCREVMQAYLDAHRAPQPARQRDRLPAGPRRAAAPRPRARRRARARRAPRLDARHAAGDQGPGADAPASARPRARRCSRDFVPEDDSDGRAHEAAGCIVIGKTNTPEFGLGSHTYNDGVRRDPQRLRPDADRRRQQRRRRGRAGDAHAAGRRRQRLHGLACATRRRGTTSSASGRRHGPRAGGRPREAFGSAARHRRADGAHRRATSPRCSPCRPATTRALPLSLDEDPRRLRRRRSTAATAAALRHRLARRPRRPPADGARHPRALRRRAARFEVDRLRRRADRARLRPGAVWEAWLVWRRWLVAARIARVLTPTREARADQARGALGARPGRSG